MIKDTEPSTSTPDIIITEPIASLRAKIRLAAELDKLSPSAPSPHDLLIEGLPRTESASEPREETW